MKLRGASPSGGKGLGTWHRIPRGGGSKNRGQDKTRRDDKISQDKTSAANNDDDAATVISTRLQFAF